MVVTNLFAIVSGVVNDSGYTARELLILLLFLVVLYSEFETATTWSTIHVYAPRAYNSSYMAYLVGDSSGVGNRTKMWMVCFGS